MKNPILDQKTHPVLGRRTYLGGSTGRWAWYVGVGNFRDYIHPSVDSSTVGFRIVRNK